MSDFSDRVDFIIDYIGNKLNEKAWREEQIKEFVEIQISKFNAEFKECEKIINRFERLKSEGKINSSNFNEFKDDKKSVRLKMRSLSDDIYFLKMLKLETPVTINKMRSLKSDKVIQPIHWLNGEESLRLFLQSIKKAGLIENRETDEIILEHFRQTDKTHQPIKWSKSNRLINYLFWQLREAGLIDKERKFKIIAEHFLNRHGKPLKSDSLKSDIEEIKYNSPKGSKVIDDIIENLETKPLQ